MPAKDTRIKTFQIAASLLLLLPLLLLVPSLSRAAATVRATSVQDVMRSQISASLEGWRSASSAAAWEADPHHPELILERLLSAGNESHISAFCLVLSGMLEPDLSLFETALEEIDDPRIPCLRNVKARIHSYWVDQFQQTKRRSRLKEGPPSRRTVTRMATRVARIDRSSLASGQLLGRRLRNPTALFQAVPLQPHEIAITLDDGPSSSYTPIFLRELAERGIRANFFQVGRRLNINYRPPITADLGSRPEEDLTDGKKFSHFMMNQGHSIGSHSMTHADLGHAPVTTAHTEILDAENILMRALGRTEIPLFRFPFGSTNPELTEWVHRQGMIPFYWDIDTNDWRNQSVEELGARIDDLLDHFPFDRAGAIILMHDIQGRTAAVFPHFLDKIEEMRLTPVVFSTAARVPLP